MAALLNYRGKEDVCTRNFSFLHYAPSLYRPPCKRSRVTAPLYFTINEETQNPNRKPQLIKKHTQINQSSIDSLPDECLFEIFRRIPDNKDKSSSACVSKKWLSLLSNIRLSEIPVKKTKLPDLNKEAINGDQDEEEDSDGSLTRCLESKESTDIRLKAISIGSGSLLGKLIIKSNNPLRGVTDSGLSAIANRCNSLRVLSIWDVSTITDLGLGFIANGCPNLEKLDLTRCPLITDKGLIQIAKKCPNLTSLTIESCEKIANEGLKSIGQFCPKLCSVNIKNCPLIGDSGISSLVSNASFLNNLKLQGLNITDNAVAFIGYYCKNLTDLFLSNLNLVGEKGFWVMANALGLQKLSNLKINSCAGFTDLALANIGKFCPSVKNLQIFKSCVISDAGFKPFAESAKKLEGFHIEECNRVTLNGIICFISVISPKFKSLAIIKCFGVKDVNIPIGLIPQLPICKSIRALAIRDCRGFTDASLAMLGKICPNLQNIEINNLGNISDNGIIPLIENCAGNLVKVNLSNNANISDVSIIKMVKLNGDKLKVMNLEGCKLVTDKSLVEIAKSCDLIDELNVSDSKVSDFGVMVLVSNQDLKFRILSLANCDKVTCKSVDFLGNLGRNIQGINLQKCNMISNCTLETLENKLWWCDILY